MSKTNWSEVVHQVTGRRHAKTISEKQGEIARLIGIIEEQEKQVEVALAIADEKAPATCECLIVTDDEVTKLGFAAIDSDSST